MTVEGLDSRLRGNDIADRAFSSLRPLRLNVSCRWEDGCWLLATVWETGGAVGQAPPYKLC